MRIVSAAPSNTEILFKLGKKSEIVANTSLCDYPDEAIEKKSIGGWSEGNNLEKVLEAEPDKVFTSDRLQEEFREKLEKHDVDVVHVSPENLEEVYSSIVRIGDSVGSQAEARDIVDEMKKGFKSIDLEDVRIYCEEWSNPPMVSGNWIPHLIELCNGDYLIERGRSREIDIEALKSFDPELIVLNICGAGENADRYSVLEREEWQDLTAVKNGDVYVIDDSLLNRPGPRLVEGMKRIESLVENVLK